MIVGMGNDLASIDRIERVLERQGLAFAERILTTNELARFGQFSKPRAKAAFLAKRFAAKEAASKALGTGIAEGVSFQHFEVNNNAKGAPELTLTEVALEKFNALGACRCHITLSDEREYAQAFVIYER